MIIIKNMLVKPTQLHCYRCGHLWTPRYAVAPKQCPHCHSSKWNTPPLAPTEPLPFKKLVWQDQTSRLVSKERVVGYFAMWAVRQSPYRFPDTLTDGIQEFYDNLEFDGNDYKKFTCATLEPIVCAAIHNSETVMSWNTSKNGDAPRHIFVSRYDPPNPGQDIIDMHALARNITHGVWLELCYDDGWFQ